MMYIRAFNKNWEEEAGISWFQDQSGLHRKPHLLKQTWQVKCQALLLSFFFFSLSFWGVELKTGFLWSLSWYSLYIDRPGWPRSWRSTCIGLLIARIKGMHHSILLLNVLNSKQENVTLNILYLKLSRCGMLTKVKRWRKMLYTIMLAGSQY